MRKMSGAALLCSVCLLLAACAPQGRVEWTQVWGNTPLPQASATCQFQANAASPALCYGLYGCLAQQNRTENLFSQCMQAAGWTSRFIPYASGPYTENKCDEKKDPACNLPPSGKTVICVINGENYSTYDNWCAARGGVVFMPPKAK